MRFLWVNLQLDSLCRVSQARKDRLIEEALHTLPRGLDETYTRILSQIDSQEKHMKDLAFRCFMWVLYSKTALSTEELQHAVAITDTCKRREDIELDDIDVILEACANLFVLDGNIRPIHYSVQEFFTNPPAGVLQKSCLNQIGEPDFVHTRLASACLHYLQLDSLRSGPCQDEGKLYTRVVDAVPLSWYAAATFDYHLQLCENISEEVCHLIDTFLHQDSPLLASVVQLRRLSERYSAFSDFDPVNFPITASTVLYATGL